MGGVLPKVVVDDEKLQCVVCDSHLQERTRPVFARRVGVLQQGCDGNIDWIGP